MEDSPSIYPRASDLVACSACEATASQQPHTWSLAVTPAGRTLLCEGCTRSHVRSVEAKLDAVWW